MYHIELCTRELPYISYRKLKAKAVERHTESDCKHTQSDQVTHLVLKNSSMPAVPLNRPHPLFLAPPCGRLGSSWTVLLLMWTALDFLISFQTRGTQRFIDEKKGESRKFPFFRYPVSICLATLNPAVRSSVNTAELRPYSVSLAISMASSSLSTTISETVGPKDSV